MRLDSTSLRARRWLVAAGCVALLIGSSAVAETPAWRALPVVEDGRLQPLDTLARTALERITGRSVIDDPETQERLDPAAWYVELIVSWQGWGHANCEQLLVNESKRPFYFHFHRADRWDRAPLFPVPDRELREILGLKPDQERVSAVELNGLRLEDESRGTRLPFALWGERFRQRPPESLAAHEREALRLVDRLGDFQDLRLGLKLRLAPTTDAARGDWLDLTTVVLSPWDKSRDPEGDRQRMQQAFVRLRDADLADDAEAWNAASLEFLQAVQDTRTHAGLAAWASRVRWEILYNRVTPIRAAWIAALLGVLASLICRSVCPAWTRRILVLSCAAAVAFAVADLALRGVITERVPLANGYEFMVVVSLVIALAGAIGEWGAHRAGIPASALSVAGLAWCLMDPQWSILDARIANVEPVLRHSWWMVGHVATLALSCAAFGLAAALANVSFARCIFLGPATADGERFDSRIRPLMAGGTVLLACGMIFGAAWTDQAWGRFWSWSAKEAGTLFVLILYVAAIQSRGNGWIGARGTAAAAVVGFGVLVLVSFGLPLLGLAGRHAFLGGHGGMPLLAVVLAAQGVVLTTALVRSLGEVPLVESSVDSASPARLRVFRDDMPDLG